MLIINEFVPLVKLSQSLPLKAPQWPQAESFLQQVILVHPLDPGQTYDISQTKWAQHKHAFAGRWALCLMFKNDGQEVPDRSG